MKLARIINAFGALIIGSAILLILALNSGPGQSRTDPPTVPIINATSETGSANSITDDPRTAEEIPLFPNAEDVVEEDSWLSHQPPEIMFQTSSSFQEVATFYKSMLSQRGWESRTDFMNDKAAVLEYLWLDSKGVAPYRLRFHLTAEGSGPTRVEISVTRLPYAGRVLVYPGAIGVEVNDIMIEYGATQRITRYAVDAQPKQLEEFYRRKMAEHGWEYGNYDENGKLIGLNSITEGLHFTYMGVGGEDGRFGGRAIITASESSDGLTQVEIRASGTDLPPQSQR